MQLEATCFDSMDSKSDSVSGLAEARVAMKRKESRAHCRGDWVMVKCSCSLVGMG